MKLLKQTSSLNRLLGMTLFCLAAVATSSAMAGETASGAGVDRQFSDKSAEGKQWRRSTENRIQDLLDKQAITEVIYHLGRSLDRMDRGLMRSVYWPEAIEEHQDPEFPVFFTDAESNPAPGTYNNFPCQAMSGFAGLRMTQHRISNILIDLVDENTAKAESYVYAYHLAGEGDKAREVTLYGRMLFNFEKRGDEWRVMRRLTVFDWFTNVPATGHFSDDYMDKFKGGRDRSQDGKSSEWHDGSDIGGIDPSYEFLNLPSEPDPMPGKGSCKFPLTK
ncbi:SnoaL-like domain-containing protein [Ferrimonas sediminum]|uniref:SnoaL-like domain-containing protein n=1 Tax=Ferrimonas sediminum TaxID=718193 RepID=A0A1G8S184_9GAMM|nr:nuclear transport factor 2 family protein [Ferrimonas sediminum]SDJ22977.1 SnoaL-like domain-containing protein [Ferrimonas sediminum]